MLLVSYVWTLVNKPLNLESEKEFIYLVGSKPTLLFFMYVCPSPSHATLEPY